MLLEAYLEQSAARAPDRRALSAGGQGLSYGQLEDLSNRVAHGLVSLGVSRGDRVAIQLESGLPQVAAIFGALKAGAAFMPIDASAKEERVTQLLQAARASAILVTGRGAQAVSTRASELPALRAIVTVGPTPPLPEGGPPRLDFQALVESAARGDSPPAAPAQRHIDQDLAALIYTSGSTGQPKGVMLTHQAVRTAIDTITAYLGNTTEDVIFNLLPLSFGYGLTQVFSAFRVGARVILEKGMVYPHATLTRMVEERATGFAMVPTIAALLLQRDLSQYDLSSLRYLTNAGAALPLEQLRRLRAALPRARLYCMYGQTECLRISYLEPADLDARPGSVGRGMPNQELWLIDEEGRRLPPGATGELVVRGAHLMRGYWEQPEATEAKLRPGPLPGERVLHTGDLFRTDPDGYLYFVSRKDEIIKSRGEKVSPREVEEVLASLPGVQEAAVVGSPDPLLGEAVKAVVVPAPGVTLTARQVQAHCARSLEDYKVPTMVELRESLPRTSTGKVAKTELR